MKVGYLGPQGTFTEWAAKGIFPKDELVPFQLIRNVVMAVEEKKVNMGVVPIENFFSGEVRETLDSLTECEKTSIVREQSMRIVHCLGALPGHSKINRIFSKDQALEQCSKYLCETYPDAHLISKCSTAEAVESIKEINLLDAAAIASEETLRNAGLEILAKDCCPNNRTRFVALGRDYTKPTGDDKTFLVIHPFVRDRAGVLRDCLNYFANSGINLESTQSRPDGKKGYYFYLELLGHERDEKVKEAVDGLRAYLDSGRKFQDAVKILGSYHNTHWKDEN